MYQLLYIYGESIQCSQYTTPSSHIKMDSTCGSCIWNPQSCERRIGPPYILNNFFYFKVGFQQFNGPKSNGLI